MVDWSDVPIESASATWTLVAGNGIVTCKLVLTVDCDCSVAAIWNGAASSEVETDSMMSQNGGMISRSAASSSQGCNQKLMTGASATGFCQ